MRQRKHGEKVQNWHRPLGRDAFRRSFLRKRYEDPDADDERNQYLSGDVEPDPYWDIYHPNYCCYCGSLDCGDSPFYEDDAKFHAFNQFLTKLGTTRAPLLDADWNAEVELNAESAEIQSAGRLAHGDRIEERLLSHIRILLGYGSLAEIETAIRESAGEERGRRVINSFAEKTQQIALVRQLYLFSPFWIRSPRTWDQQSFASLVDHLFVRYEAPRFLLDIWHDRWQPEREPESDLISGKYLKWVCWFILLAQGRSLKRAAPLFGWKIPRGFVQQLAGVPRTRRFPQDLVPRYAHVPHKAEMVEACIRSWVLSQGGSTVDVLRILSSPAFVVDPTEVSQTSAHSEFWEETVRWLIAHREQLTDIEADAVLEWAMHEFTEANRVLLRFSWRGRSVRATIARSLAYRQALADPGHGWSNPFESYRWAPHNLNWEDRDEYGSWSFTEITSGAELFEEGREMQHCVGSYAALCVAGHSAIVSVRRNGARRLTVEVNPRARQVVQICGMRNRKPMVEEMTVIQSWIKVVLAKRD